MLQFVRENIANKDFLVLLIEVLFIFLNIFLYRGYIIVGSESNVEEVFKVQFNRRLMWYVFFGMGIQWFGMGEKLMQILIFSEFIYRIVEILKEFGVDFVKIIIKSDDKIYIKIINFFVGLVFIQIVLVDCLKVLGKVFLFVRIC